MVTTVADASSTLKDSLLSEVKAQQAPLVGKLLTDVARELDSDVPMVASAMWDLVEGGILHYGADAHVRLA